MSSIGIGTDEEVVTDVSDPKEDSAPPSKPRDVATTIRCAHDILRAADELMCRARSMLGAVTIDDACGVPLWPAAEAAGQAVAKALGDASVAMVRLGRRSL